MDNRYSYCDHLPLNKIIVSQFSQMFLTYFDEVFHLVFSVFAVVVLEIEVFGHQSVQSYHVQ